MIEYTKGNLLDSDCDYICHQVNCRGVMGAGIAKQIRDRWPFVYDSYRAYCERCRLKNVDTLGEIWGVKIDRVNRNSQWIVNMFAQEDFGHYGSRFTSYDAFEKCLEKIRDRIPKDKTIGFPKGIGCGLGGGDWKIISALIESMLGNSHHVYIYEFKEVME